MASLAITSTGSTALSAANRSALQVVLAQQRVQTDRLEVKQNEAELQRSEAALAASIESLLRARRAETGQRSQSSAQAQAEGVQALAERRSQEQADFGTPPPEASDRAPQPPIARRVEPPSALLFGPRAGSLDTGPFTLGQRIGQLIDVTA